MPGSGEGPSSPDILLALRLTPRPATVGPSPSSLSQFFYRNSLRRGGHQQVAVPEQRLRGGIPAPELPENLRGVDTAAEREHGVPEAPARVCDRLLVFQTHFLEGREGVG